MKKLATLVNSALLTLTAASPVLAQGTFSGVQPENAKIMDLGIFISKSISLVMLISSILVFIFLVWGGLEWLTSGGDKGKTESARNRITAALVGLAIIAASWALVRLIAYFFGLESGLNSGFSNLRGF